ncbi:YbfB/YjiJ family MFS transporter [Thalassobaculum litoreum]|uniref:Predicted arabinose efflux permease, MFS family n=1 Tax=Thalassobaculum litoreum DSM 18839 TaxID=1123362 RepID=A0A8G2BIS5_9PROT|nr:YbfB/YjiJ family MFS transporter [Thalassobaculum litoreum]SDF94619.1 Predicted arabinose efflux permease, MFS family [Thalassobaculum litoreum DSM 18839]
MSETITLTETRERMPWRAVAAGCAAMLVGIGLARFAYTPLIPAVVDAGWFAPAAALYLGAANLLGYLAGAMAGNRLSGRFGAVPVLRWSMAASAVSLLVCAEPLGFLWVFVWRLVAGIAGGALMVVAAPTALARVPQGRRGLAGGLIFTGVGLGIAVSGTLVPMLLQVGLAQTWLALGGLCSVLTVLVWRWWPQSGAPRRVGGARVASGGAMIALLAVYGLIAAGLVPHMVLLVDFVVRGLERSFALGAAVWIALGIGAVCGPTLAGRLADRIGFAAGLRLYLVVVGLAVVALAVGAGEIGLFVSAVVGGASIPGVVPLVLGRVHDLVEDPSARLGTWGRATMAFAVGQAAGAYGFSALYDRVGSYPLIFALAAGLMALALAIDLVWVRRPTP